MMEDDEDPRVSDEVTGLPSLLEIDEQDTMLLAAWSASIGVATSPVTGDVVAVRFLHCRGLVRGADGTPEWGQVFVAVPVEHALDVAAALAKGSVDDL
jgi:hypothetical protein